MELLTERGLGFAFCLNKAQVLVLSGFVFLYSAVHSQRDGFMAKDNQRLVSVVLGELQKGSPSLAQSFGAVASSVVSVYRGTSPNRSNLDQAISPMSRLPNSPELQHSTVKRSSSSASGKMQRSPAHSATGEIRRSSSTQDFAGTATPAATMHMMSPQQPHQNHAHIIPRSRSLQHHQLASAVKAALPRHSVPYEPAALEFLWGMDAAQSMSEEQVATPHAPADSGASSTDDWERMLAIMDASHAQHIYGDGSGPVPPAAVVAETQRAASMAANEEFHTHRYEAEMQLAR